MTTKKPQRTMTDLRKDLPIFKSISNTIALSSRIRLLAHRSADGDSLGSMIAMGRFLTDQLGKEVFMPYPESFPVRYAFLENYCKDFRHDSYNDDCLTILFDCSSSSRIDNGPNNTVPSVDILIDHHEGIPNIGDIIYKDTNAPAAGLLVYRFLRYAEAEFTAEISDAIYTAILTDTGQFAFSGTTVECFSVAGFLVEHGASPERVAREVYWNHSLSYISNMRTALNNLRFYVKGRLSIIRLTRDNVEHPDLLNMTEGIVDLGIMIEGVEIALLLREMAPDNIRVSFRSRPGYDVSKIAAHFNGGGRINASGCNLHTDIDTAEKQLRQIIIPILEA